MLFIASVSASRPSPGTAAYGAAKAGLVNAVTSLAVEWAPRVRVCAISPSLVQTESAAEGHYGDGDALDAIRATIPAGRLATPDDVAAACLFSHRPTRRTRRCEPAARRRRRAARVPDSRAGGRALMHAWPTVARIVRQS